MKRSGSWFLLCHVERKSRHLLPSLCQKIRESSTALGMTKECSLEMNVYHGDGFVALCHFVSLVATKFEDYFSAAFGAGGMFNCGFRFAQRV
jgi:hypothetical protein